MENCINCNKEFTKRGIKLHLKKCDQVYLLHLCTIKTPTKGIDLV